MSEYSPENVLSKFAGFLVIVFLAVQTLRHIFKNTTAEQALRLVTFETFVQADEETGPGKKTICDV